ncbi:MAG: hypothetical protein K9K21_02905 [Desulfotignum sp.]|nr:hypothetical protein [Desulfotignum sp.]
MAKDNEMTASQLVNLCRDTGSSTVSIIIKDENEQPIAAVVAINGSEHVAKALNAIDEAMDD